MSSHSFAIVWQVLEDFVKGSNKEIYIPDVFADHTYCQTIEIFLPNQVSESMSCYPGDVSIG